MGVTLGGAAMSTKAVGKSLARERAWELRRGWHALVALIVTASVACGESDPGETVGPPTPGSISVTTQTSGFLKDDSYELLVDGESRGTIGANDEVAVSELDPATYEVDLADVASNCVAESTSVPVVSEETADVSLTVVCAPSEPDAYTLRFTRDRPDLDTGAITDCLFGLCSSEEEWDLHVHFNSQGDVRAVIRQNLTTGVEIAHLPGVALAELTEEDVEGATFTTALVADPFDSGRVILIRTDVGNLYALGNPVEDSMMQTLAFDATLIATP
jgi:hypothetical protein